MKKSKILGISLVVTIILISIILAIFESWAWPENNNLNWTYDGSYTIPQNYRIWHRIYDDIWECSEGHILTQSYSYLDANGSKWPNSTRENFYAQGATCTYMKSKYGSVCGATLTRKPNTKKLVSFKMADMTETYKNVYCVERNEYPDLLDDGDGARFNLRTIAKAMIRGENVTFEGYDYSTGDVKKVTGKSSKTNHVIAAMLTIDDFQIGSRSSLGFGYYSNKDEGTISKSGAQIGLWMYWDSWVESSGASQVGFRIGNNITSKDPLYEAEIPRGNKMIEEAERRIAEGNTYSADLYFLQYKGSEDNPGRKNYGLQNILLVDPQPNELTIPVRKVWDDENNAYNNRPSSITVQLYEDGQIVEGKTLELNSSNNWSGEFTRLDGNKTYTIAEVTSLGNKYTSSITGEQSTGFTITNTLVKINIPVQKVWEDDNDSDGKRPASITVSLYANGTKFGNSVTLNSTNSWKYTFSNLPKYKDGKAINYTIKEDAVNGYTTSISPSTISSDNNNSVTTGFKVTNKISIIDIPVQKVWDDENNRDGKRPTSVTVTLYADGTQVGNPVTLNSTNSWKHTFTNLPKYKNGKAIKYTIKEATVNGYTASIKPESISSDNKDTVKAGFTITNKHVPEKTQVKVTKTWNDENNLDDLRPTSITVTLYANGKATDKTLTLKEGEGWTGAFTDLYKYENGKEIVYTVVETAVTGYTSKITGDAKNGFTITNTHTVHYDGYIEITGKVWEDDASGKGNDLNGTFGNEDKALSGIKVTLKDANGKQFDATSIAYTDSNGNYTIKVNYDNTKNVYKLYEDVAKVKEKLKTAYVEFEYDAYTYTTVATATTGANTSKAKENATLRNNFDKAHTKVTPSTATPDKWSDRKITASTNSVISFASYADKTTAKSTEVIKYCNGNGKDIHTNIQNSWLDIKQGKHTCKNCKNPLRTYEVEVEKIQNVNLGLFKREQPDIAIFSDLSKVEVTMQNQKYTYLYNKRSADLPSGDEAKLKVKFQNKDTYTYRRPVNPADIAFVNDGNNDAMKVQVTYEVTVGNLSTTLPVTVHNIINSFDNRYTLDTPGWVTTTGTQFNQATYNGDLKIKLDPLKESEKIQLTYTINMDAIKSLLRQEATLNNAVEIQSFSTVYGKDTLYAEFGKGTRAGTAYAGYDFDSHPGNAGLFINNEGRLEAAKPEDDTDIAPSFVLCKDAQSKILSGNVWEDSDANNTDNLRLGDGIKANNDKNVANVKVELYKVKPDGTTELAYLYNRSENAVEEKIPAVTYTNSDGYYSFGNENYSVVTDVYQIKFTYGDGIEKDGSTISSTIDNVNINARNYKSTIINSGTEIYNLFKGTSNSQDWHLNLNKGYSIAVDEVQNRLVLEDLQYSNFNDKFNMVAYSKPFMMQVEFDPSNQKQSTVSEDGKTSFGNELNVFDFGLIEKAREDIFVETTIDNIQIILPNGQKLTQGNPKDSMNYAKSVGFKQNINSGTAARNALEKQISIEIDTALIQGAELEVKYAIKVTNNSEVDYDYYIGDETQPFDASKLRTEYYYFGTNSENSPEMQQSAKYVVDYLDSELECDWENEADWTLVEDAQDLKDQGLISETTFNNLADDKYAIYTTTKFSELGYGESMTDYITATKLLTNQDENVYDNHIEVLKIDDRIARTLKGKDSRGTVLVKQYKPGNYVSSFEARTINTDINLERAGLHEQDDDMVKIMITPPTGAGNYIITYIIAALAGLIVIVVGIIFIKKKVLTK